MSIIEILISMLFYAAVAGISWYGGYKHGYKKGIAANPSKVEEMNEISGG